MTKATAIYFPNMASAAFRIFSNFFSNFAKHGFYVDAVFSGFPYNPSSLSWSFGGSICE